MSFALTSRLRHNTSARGWLWSWQSCNTPLDPAIFLDPLLECFVLLLRPPTNVQAAEGKLYHRALPAVKQQEEPSKLPNNLRENDPREFSGRVLR